MRGRWEIDRVSDGSKEAVQGDGSRQNCRDERYHGIRDFCDGCHQPEGKKSGTVGRWEIWRSESALGIDPAVVG